MRCKRVRSFCTAFLWHAEIEAGGMAAGICIEIAPCAAGKKSFFFVVFNPLGKKNLLFSISCAKLIR